MRTSSFWIRLKNIGYNEIVMPQKDFIPTLPQQNGITNMYDTQFLYNINLALHIPCLGGRLGRAARGHQRSVAMVPSRGGDVLSTALVRTRSCNSWNSLRFSALSISVLGTFSPSTLFIQTCAVDVWLLSVTFSFGVVNWWVFVTSFCISWLV